MTADSGKIVSEGESILAALRKNADGLTTPEIAEDQGISEVRTRKLLAALKKAGRLKIGKKYIMSLDNVSARRTCYQVVEPGKAGKPRKS